MSTKYIGMAVFSTKHLRVTSSYVSAPSHRTLSERALQYPPHATRALAWTYVAASEANGTLTRASFAASATRDLDTPWRARFDSQLPCKTMSRLTQPFEVWTCKTNVRLCYLWRYAVFINWQFSNTSWYWWRECALLDDVTAGTAFTFCTLLHRQTTIMSLTIFIRVVKNKFVVLNLHNYSWTVEKNLSQVLELM